MVTKSPKSILFKDLINAVHSVLEVIDLDPISSSEVNNIMKAKKFISENSLKTEWDKGTLFVNPPKGKKNSKAQELLFWEKLMQHRAQRKLNHAIFIGSDINILESSKDKTFLSAANFPFCIISKKPNSQFSHNLIILYVPGTKDNSYKFLKAFKDLGALNHIL